MFEMQATMFYKSLFLGGGGGKVKDLSNSYAYSLSNYNIIFTF